MLAAKITRVTVTSEPVTVRELLEKQLSKKVTLNWNPAGTVVLAIDSEKGGVGKSGLTGGLAAVMARNNYKVLAIDLDPRATLTAELGADEGEFTVNDLLYVDPSADPDDLPELSGLAEQALRPAGEAWGDNVRVLAAERALANRETDSASGMEHRLRVALEGVAEQFDLVVIDLPPRAGGKLVGSGLLAATHVIFPGTLDEDGLIGVRDARRSYKFMSQTNPRGLREVGVLRNIVDTRVKLVEHYNTRFAEEFGDKILDVMVPKRVIRQEARSACIPITVAEAKKDARELINGYTHVLNKVGRI